MKRIHKVIATTAAAAAVILGASQMLPSTPAKTGPADIYPNAALTPGATNPDITQANIADTLCNPSWSTKSIRPPVTVTGPLKLQQIDQYGYTDKSPASYEEDHLISLELGGAPSDPKNLWPEPYTASIPDGGAKQKDTVENLLHKEVCAGTITLAQAQQQIVQDWYAIYKGANSGKFGSDASLDSSDPDDE